MNEPNRISRFGRIRARIPPLSRLRPLLLALMVLLVSSGADEAAALQGGNGKPQKAGSGLDQITQAIERKYGRVLKVTRDANGRIKAKVLTDDGRVRHLDLDPGQL